MRPTDILHLHNLLMAYMCLTNLATEFRTLLKPLKIVEADLISLQLSGFGTPKCPCWLVEHTSSYHNQSIMSHTILPCAQVTNMFLNVRAIQK